MGADFYKYGAATLRVGISCTRADQPVTALANCPAAISGYGKSRHNSQGNPPEPSDGIGQILRSAPATEAPTPPFGPQIFSARCRSSGGKLPLS